MSLISQNEETVFCTKLVKTRGEGAKMFRNRIFPRVLEDIYGCWALLKWKMGLEFMDM